MNEEERRLEIPKAEAAIRELAGRMAEAIECTNQADMARSALENAVNSMEALAAECRELLEFQKDSSQENSKALDRARESLETGAKDLRWAKERLEKQSEHIESSMEEKNQEFYELIDAKLDKIQVGIDNSQNQLTKREEHFESSVRKQNQEFRGYDVRLGNLSLGMSKIHDQLSENKNNFEAFMDEKSQEYHELLDSKLGDLSQEIDAVSERLLFIIDQNEASVKRALALERTIEGLSEKLQEYENAVASNSEELQELETEMLDRDKRLASLEGALETKASGFSHRLRSAIIGGGLGVVIAFMIIRVF